jgi:gliding motility-associated-like protein
MRTFDKSLNYLIATIFLLAGTIAYSQAETNNWFFGYGAGMEFNGGSPTFLPGGQVDTEEGSAAMSDENGNLLFYTDGETVWSSDHSIMANGTGLLGNASTTQTLIIQKPTSDSIYYLFSINPSCGVAGIVGTKLFAYSVIDISLNNGLGEVIDTNNILFQTATERVTAVKHCNNEDIWIVAMEDGTSSTDPYVMRSYLLTSDGINAVPVETILPDNYHGCAGALKASPNGEYIAWDANYCNFDKSTGHVYNFSYHNKAAYGVEFSPNSKILYANNYQIELSSGDLFEYTPFHWIRAMQLASDGKIYAATYTQDDLAVIHSPNVFQAPGFIQEDFELLDGTSIYAGLGMPNFAPYYFYDDPGEITYNSDCPNDAILFEFVDPSGIDSAIWIFDNTHFIEGFNASNLFSEEGYHSITSVIYINGIADTSEHCIEITGLYDEFLGDDLEGCFGDTLEIGLLSTIEGAVIWSTGETSSSITVTQSGWYWAEITDNCSSYRDSINLSFLECDSVFIVPNIFTPNGDGFNDFFHVNSTQKVDQFDGQIFNRWGEIVGELTDQFDVWDGTNIKNNAECSDGVYYYTISYLNSFGNSMSKVGFFHLVR